MDRTGNWKLSNPYTVDSSDVDLVDGRSLKIQVRATIQVHVLFDPRSDTLQGTWGSEAPFHGLRLRNAEGAGFAWTS